MKNVEKNNTKRKKKTRVIENQPTVYSSDRSRSSHKSDQINGYCTLLQLFFISYDRRREIHRGKIIREQAVTPNEGSTTARRIHHLCQLHGYAGRVRRGREKNDD